MDEQVLKTQKWVNAIYTGVSGYTPIAEDGVTGTSTFKALIEALQIELGLSADGVFGDGTLSACPAQISEVADVNTAPPSNLHYIIQGSFWCKGYNPGGFDGVFGPATTSAVEKFEVDAGITQDGIIKPYILKAIMNTDGYALASAGDVNIREVQTGLNSMYGATFGLSPSNGIWERNSHKNLIKALQTECGVTADGAFGSGTLSACPTLSKNTSGYPNTKRILQWALCVNGYYPGGFTGTFGDGTYNAVMSFQKFFCLSADGIVGKNSWGALMTSCGDTSRAASACDCATILTTEKAAALKYGGYSVVGRYLTGTANGISKALTVSEIQIIFNAGLAFFPIYQAGGANNAYFGSAQGTVDAKAAIEAAESLGIPSDTIIYFAVDYDALDTQINSNVLPHFQAINSYFSSAVTTSYRIGIYGSRNICTSVCDAGYAVSSFVGDMSSGYSGNLGYQMPENWAFDQFYTTTVGSGSGLIEIDKDAYSGRDTGIANFAIVTDDEIEEAVVEKLSSFISALGAPYPQVPIVLQSSVTYEVPISDEAKVSYRIEKDTTLFDNESSSMTITIENGTSYVETVNLMDSISMNFGIDATQPSIAPIASISAEVGNGNGKVSVSTDGTWINTSYTISTEVEVNAYYKQKISFSYTISIKNSSFDNFAYQEALVSNASQQVYDKVNVVGTVIGIGVVVVVAFAACAFIVAVTDGATIQPATTAFIAVLAFLGLTEESSQNNDDSES